MTKNSEWMRLKPSAHAGLFLLIAAGFLMLGMIYHVVAWAQGVRPSGGWYLLYHFLVLGGFAALWRLISQSFKHRAVSPIGIFWTILIAGVIVAGVGWTAWAFAPNVVRPIAAEDLSLAVVAHMHFTVLLEALFFFFILARLRQLVLFKRTRRSKRAWQVMLGLMCLAAIAALPLAPDDSLGWLQAVFIVPAVIVMVICAFRLSWIIFLSFKEKMVCMSLALGVVVMLALRSGLRDGFLPAGEAYLQFYSYPLEVFLMLVAVFAILYSTTAWASLLFHLPTTSDFQRKADEMAAMHGLTHLVGQAFDKEKLTRSIVAAPIEAGSAYGSWLMLPDSDASHSSPEVVGASGIPRERIEENIRVVDLYRDVVRSREPLLIDEAAADHRIEASPGAGIGSLLAVPLTAREQIVGVLFSVSDVSHGFENDDIETISGFAAQAALALDHAHLFQEQIEKERLERELAIAREVQQRMLPSTLPNVPGVSLFASSVPALEVGGDYYDFLRLDDDRLAFMIADVSGKGTSAAFYMAVMQGIFRSTAPLSPEPTEFLKRANQALLEVADRGTFISAIYGILDPQRESLTLARAGHCPVATINLHGSARYLRPEGMGLGICSGEIFDTSIEASSLTLQPGDTFVLYTDGLVESRNPSNNEFGYDRLLTSLQRHRHEDVEAMHEAILEEVRAFTRAKLYDDDMTMVVLKWHAMMPSDPAWYQTEPHEAMPVPLESTDADLLTTQSPRDHE